MQLAKMLISLDRRLNGLRRKAVQVRDHRIVYSEGGKSDSEPVLMVHGFSASADNWNRMAAQLRSRYHVIAPDLPGWGESTRLDSASYSYAIQIERLHDFLQQIGMSRFHLVGHSMGGCISAGYAARYPDQVITLGLLAPHGISEPLQSELAICVGRGDNWLVASSVEGFERLMNNLFVKRPYVPGPVLKYMARQMVRRSAKTQGIFDEIQASNPPLLECLGKIKAPTLIVWGDEDKLIHVSAAEVFRGAIGNSEVLIMEKTGHMPLLENVKQCGAAYTAFLEKQRRGSHAAA